MTQHLSLQKRWFSLAGLLLAALLPMPVSAAEGSHLQDFTSHWASWLAVALFVVAYSFVIAEEALHLRKSKPVMFAVLAMQPAMDQGQWLLVTLTAGVGGSPCYRLDRPPGWR